MVKWTVTLKPGQRRAWRVEYQIEYPTGLAKKSRRKRRGQPTMRDEIINLERLF